MTAKKAAVVYWQPNDGLAEQHQYKLEKLGWDVVKMLPNAPIAASVEFVLCYGPLDSLVPLARRLQAMKPSARPRFGLIQTEQLPNPGLPEWLRYPLSLARSGAERFSYHRDKEGVWKVWPGLGWITQSGFRFRYYGDLYWLRCAGLLSVLATWSRRTAVLLERRHFAPVVLKPDLNPGMGRDLGLVRDIPVLWLGKIGSERRRRLLQRVRADLAARGVELMVIDGVEHPYVFGEARTKLLNRAKIMLNLLREEWDDNSLRYALATHNGVLVVSEPTWEHSAYKPGVHIVETAVTDIADTICHYLAHEDARKQIVGQATEMIRRNAAAGGYMHQIVKAAFADTS